MRADKDSATRSDTDADTHDTRDEARGEFRLQKETLRDLTPGAEDADNVRGGARCSNPAPTTVVF